MVFCYRLAVRLKSAEAKALEVDGLLAEVQLHVRAMFILKSAGGHKLYKLIRNMKAA